MLGNIRESLQHSERRNKFVFEDALDKYGADPHNQLPQPRSIAGKHEKKGQVAAALQQLRQEHAKQIYELVLEVFSLSPDSLHLTATRMPPRPFVKTTPICVAGRGTGQAQIQTDDMGMWSNNSDTDANTLTSNATQTLSHTVQLTRCSYLR